MLGASGVRNRRGTHGAVIPGTHDRIALGSLTNTQHSHGGLSGRNSSQEVFKMITGSSNNAQQSTPRKASTQQSTAAPAPTSQQITAVQGILQSPVPRDMHRHASAGGSITVAQPHTDTSDLHQIDDVHDVPNGSARASGAAGGGRGASEDPRYPADLNGFLSGITQSLMNVDATQLWHSSKGMVHRVFIDPLLRTGDGQEEAWDMWDDPNYLGIHTPVAPDNKKKIQERWKRTDEALAARMPSKWANTKAPDQYDIAFERTQELPEDDAENAPDRTPSHKLSGSGGAGGLGMKFGGSKARPRKGLGARKLAKTPVKTKPKSAKDPINTPTAPDTEGKKDPRRAKSSNGKVTVGSIIDIPRLRRAKKVNVYGGGGVDENKLMVVGQRRLVVVEGKPSEKHPNRGVVTWLTYMEEVNTIAWLIQPLTDPKNSGNMCVEVHVDVKIGDKYVFVVGIQDSINMVQLITCRMNGAPEPAHLSTPQQPHQQPLAQPPSLASGIIPQDQLQSTPQATPRTPSKAGPPSSSGLRRATPMKSMSPRKVDLDTGASIYVSTPTKSANGNAGLKIVLSPTATASSLVVSEVSTPVNCLMSPTAAGHSKQIRRAELGKRIAESAPRVVNVPSSSSSEPALTSTSSGPSVDLSKFAKMAKAGVPMPAIAIKMASEGVGQAHVDAFAADPAKFLPPSEAQPQQQSNMPCCTSTAASASDKPQGNRAALDALTPKEKERVGKYIKMLKAKVPEMAVRLKMQSEGIEDRLIEAVFEGPASEGSANAARHTIATPSSTTNAAAASAMEKPEAKPKQDEAPVLSEADLEKVAKYQRMLKARVPEMAVRNKMEAEGIEQRLVDAVCTTTIPPESRKKEGDTVAGPVATLTPEEEAKVAKYRQMSKTGLPEGAVRHKMRMDGIEDRIADIMFGASGSTGGGGAAKGGPGRKKDGASAPPARRPSKLLTLHWTPLVVDKEQIEQTVWGKGKKGTTNPKVPSPEMQKLTALFSRKTAAPAKKRKDGDTDGPKKKKKVNVIDQNRAQNISIGLKSFKQFKPQDIADRVMNVCCDDMCSEQLNRLEEMLPTNQEIGAVQRHVKQEMKKNASTKCEESAEGAAVEDAHAHMPELPEAEALCYAFRDVKRAKAKLGAMVAMKTFHTHADDLLSKFELIERACEQITTSSRFARLLSEVLTVGNVMNEGTQKGGAQGFTVDSLLKLTQTRSVCKSMTVLDYIVDALMVKGEEDPVEFADELPDLQAAARLPLTELCSQVQILSGSVHTAKRELRAMQNDLTARAAPPVTRQRSKALKQQNSSAPGACANLLSELKSINVQEGEGGEQGNKEGDAAPSKASGADPRAGLLAAIRSRGSKDEGAGSVPANPRAALMSAIAARASAAPAMTRGATPASGAGGSGSEGGDNATVLQGREPPHVKKLEKFVKGAETKASVLTRAANEVKTACADMASFLGETGQDPGHILTCLVSFAELTKASKEKRERRIATEERNKRIQAANAAKASAKSAASSRPRSVSAPEPQAQGKPGVVVGTENSQRSAGMPKEEEGEAGQLEAASPVVAKAVITVDSEDGLDHKDGKTEDAQEKKRDGEGVLAA